MKYTAKRIGYQQYLYRGWLIAAAWDINDRVSHWNMTPDWREDSYEMPTDAECTLRDAKALIDFWAEQD